MPSSRLSDPSPVADKRATRIFKDYIGLAARGFAMGSSDVVPGVSGGTMAFILGIYQELIHSIRTVAQPAFLQAVVKLRVKEALRILNWPFLVSVAAGILLAFFTLARGLEWMYNNEPVLLFSFFFGLVVASIITVSKRVRRWKPPLFAALAAGTVGAYFLVGAVPAQTPETWWFLFLSGAFAICAMILPGISGAFILLILGKYEYVLSALNNRDFGTLIIVALGAGVGIVSFAQVLDWLFKRYHDATVAVLTGFMLGSLRKIWPWKETLATIVDRHGEIVPTVQINTLPPAYDGLFLAAVGLAIVGAAAVILLDRLAADDQ